MRYKEKEETKNEQKEEKETEEKDDGYDYPKNVKGDPEKEKKYRQNMEIYKEYMRRKAESKQRTIMSDVPLSRNTKFLRECTGPNCEITKMTKSKKFSKKPLVEAKSTTDVSSEDLSMIPSCSETEMSKVLLNNGIIFNSKANTFVYRQAPAELVESNIITKFGDKY